MPIQITIIGLGQMGASIGLALSAHKDQVKTLGHDKDFSIESRAKKLGAVNVTNHNLPGSVEKADLVILAIPAHQLRETFGYIAEDLTRELLPQTSHYIGLAPAIGAQYLDGTGTGLDSARADLFSKGVFLLSTAPGVPGAAVKLVTEVVSLLGASTILTDFVESDGLMTSAHLLPELVAASLLNTTIDQPGWQEVRKVAGSVYYRSTAAIESDDAEALSMLALQNRQNLIRALNGMVTSIMDVLDDLDSENKVALMKRLESARKGRDQWLNERDRADWSRMPGEPVEKISLMESLFGSKLGKAKKK